MFQCVMDSGLTAALDMVQCRHSSGQGVIKHKTNPIQFYLVNISLSVYLLGMLILSYIVQCNIILGITNKLKNSSLQMSFKLCKILKMLKILIRVQKFTENYIWIIHMKEFKDEIKSQIRFTILTPFYFKHRRPHPHYGPHLSNFTGCLS